MTVTIDLKPELEARLQEQARARALTLDDYVAKLVEEAAGAAKNRAAMELLASWETEDATEDTAELEARRADWEALKAAMNEGRSSDRALFT
jgi:hypothetical protein